MKLIDLLELFKEPNPSGYVEIIHPDNTVIQSTGQRLLSSLSDTTLSQEVARASLSTKVSSFPVIKIYIKEDKDDG